MYKIEKLLLLILCFIIAISCITVYASERDMDSDELTDAAGLLSALNVVDSNMKDTDFSVGMTRAKFLQILSRILNVKEDPNTDVNYYKDMEGHWAQSIVNYFVEKRIISVTDNRTFRPDDFITPSEAYKILVTLTGYGVQAENRGGYPAGYILTANLIDIVPGTINNQDYLTTEEAYLLIYKAITIPLYNIDSISGSDVSYKVEKEKSLLSVYHDIYYDEGYVYSANGLSVNDSKSRENEIVVNEESYFTDESVYTEYYLGKYVKLYYVDNKDSARKMVTYISCDDKHDNYVEIDAKLVKGVDKDYKLEYYHDNTKSRTSTVELSRSMSMIYNGEKIEKDFTRIFDELNNGYVRLLDVDSDGVYEDAIIKSYTDIVIGYYDELEDTIYDKLTKNTISFSDCENVYFYSAGYKKVEPSALAEGMILSVAYSEGNYLEGIISSGSASGSLEEIEKGGDTPSVLMNGKEYSIGSDFVPYFNDKFFVGDNVTVYLNAFSEIAYMESKGDSAFSFGYLCDLGVKEGVAGLLEMKIFCKDGSMKIFNTAERVIVDGVMQKNSEDIVNAMPGCSAEDNVIKDYQPQVIQYRLNTDGKICEIDTTVLTSSENARNSLAHTVQYSQTDGSASVVVTSQSTNLRRLGMSDIVNASTIIFMVPDSETIKSGNAEDYQFRLGTIANDLIVDDTVTIDGYRTDVLNGNDELLLIYNNGIKQWDGRVNLMVVDKITKGIDAEGNRVFRIKGMRGGKNVAYDVSPDYDFNKLSLKPDSGDTIGITTNARNQIADIKMLYDFSAGGTPKSQGLDWGTDNRYVGGSAFSKPFQCSFMYPSYVSDTVIKCTYDNTASDYLTNCNEAIDTKSYSITVYDGTRENNRLYLGSVSDIRDIYSVGPDKCSRILVHTRNRITYDIIVYK